MATFYLDVDDEITSAVARIRTSDERLIALVLPAGSRLATSRINFRLLAREAQARHRRLVVVAPEASVRALAGSAGLPVFATVGEFESAAGDIDSDGSAPAAAARSGDLAAAGFDGVAATAAGATAGAAGSATAVTAPAGVRPAARTGLHDSGRPVREATAGEAGAKSVRRRRIGLRGFLLLGLLALVALTGGVAAYLFLPSATIVVTQREEPLGPTTFSVRIDPAATAVDPAQLVVPGMNLTFPLQQVGTFKATGTKTNDTAATGTVTMQNCDTGRGHTIPSGTIVSTDGGVQFATTAALALGRASVAPFSCTSGDVTVTAVKKGTAGNVPAGAISNMPPAYDPVLFPVTNSAATSGGTHVVLQIISQSDVEKAKAALAQQLVAQFNATLADPSSAPAGQQLFPSTAVLGSPKFDPDPATLVNRQVSAATASFELVATSSATATAGDMNAVKTLASQRIAGSVQSGYHLVDGSTSVQLGEPAVEGNAIVVPVSAQARQVRELDAAALKAAVKGKSVDDAKAYLAQFGDVRLSVDPGWVSNIPTYDFRIDFRVEAPPPSGSPSPAASVSPGSSEGPPSGGSASPGESPSAVPSASASPS